MFGSDGLKCQDDPHGVRRFASEYHFFEFCCFGEVDRRRPFHWYKHKFKWGPPNAEAGGTYRSHASHPGYRHIQGYYNTPPPKPLSTECLPRDATCKRVSESGVRSEGQVICAWCVPSRETDRVQGSRSTQVRWKVGSRSCRDHCRPSLNWSHASPREGAGNKQDWKYRSVNQQSKIHGEI